MHVPVAGGDGAGDRAAAEGYKEARIAEATGDANRFTLIETQYKAAPDVTRKRLYLETMQSVVGTTKTVIDGSGGKNLLYLPVDGAARGAPDAAAALGADGAPRAKNSRGGGQ
jgi:membrane protease subunit HflK